MACSEIRSLSPLGELQDQIAEATINPSAVVGNCIREFRPLLQSYLLNIEGDPTAADEPAKYYDTLRIAEEALRRPILRGLGYIATTSLIEHTLENLGKNSAHREQTSSDAFTAESGLGRIHQHMRGEFVREVDATLRGIASCAFSAMQAEKEEDLFQTFWDISQRVRDLSGETLDHRIGDAWRTLDAKEIARVRAKELNGQPIKKYDRHLLVKTRKPLDIHTSFGNAVATTAEFTAIGIEAMHRALAQAGCPRDEWYAQSFAHINKLSFGARLPFWAAQDFAIEANDDFPPPLFSIASRWPSRYHVSYARRAHQNYLEKGITGDCQGIFLAPRRLSFEENRMREHLVFGIERIVSSARHYIAWTDIPAVKDVTSVDAATALALSVANKRQYNL